MRFLLTWSNTRVRSARQCKGIWQGDCQVIRIPDNHDAFHLHQRVGDLVPSRSSGRQGRPYESIVDCAPGFRISGKMRGVFNH